MKEGDISHEEVNAAIAAADKTIIFGRQNRLRDGLLLDDQKLQRFHAGHDKVKFFYSAVRQLPAYFLDALLAKNITVTLVLGKGLLLFKDVRNHQAVHSGRTRRTIYLPEKVLDVAVNNGYDYWSISQVLIVEGWKLLDFVLLLELIREGKRFMLEHTVSVLGYTAVRRFLKWKNKHRGSYVSPERMQKKESYGLDMDTPLNELEEFTEEYEPKLLKVMRYGEVGRLGSGVPMDFRKLSPSEVATGLFNEHRERVWAKRKAEELCEEQEYPDYFLLDRDILHPAARELAEVAGQDITPKNMTEARHDYRDKLRFGIGLELATEKLVEEAMRFVPEGLKGLVEEIVESIFATGEIDQRLMKWTQEGLQRNTTRKNELLHQLNGGIDLIRLREMLLFNGRVRSGEQKLQLEDIEFLRGQMVRLVETKESVYDPRRREMILMMTNVDEIFDQLKSLLVGEAKRLLGPQVTAENIDTPALLEDIERQVERTMLEMTLCLEMMPNYHATVERLAAKGTGVTQEVLERFLIEAKSDPARQIGAAAAQRGLEARSGGKRAAVDSSADAPLLGDLYERVNQIVELFPQRPHTATSGLVTGLRKAMREFETLRRQEPTHPKQLGALAMVLVRLDLHEDYEQLWGYIRWMGDYAVGNLVVGGGLNRWYTSGLLKVIDEVGPKQEPIGTSALSLALELTEIRNLEILIMRRTVAS